MFTGVAMLNSWQKKKLCWLFGLVMRRLLTKTSWMSLQWQNRLQKRNQKVSSSLNFYPRTNEVGKMVSSRMPLWLAGHPTITFSFPKHISENHRGTFFLNAHTNHLGGVDIPFEGYGLWPIVIILINALGLNWNTPWNWRRSGRLL